MSEKYLLAAGLAVFLLFCAAGNAGEETLAEKRRRAKELCDAGMFRDAVNLYQEIVFDPANTPRDAGSDMLQVVHAARRLDSQADMADLYLRAAEYFSGSWRVLSVLAEEALSTHLRGYSRQYNPEYDRIRALRLMLQAERVLDDPADPADRRQKVLFYERFANIVVRKSSNPYEFRFTGGAWMLTALTDLDSVPEPDAPAPYFAFGRQYAPVDAEGNPVFYQIPESWDAAVSDGERWRWLLKQMTEYGGAGEADMLLADFLTEQLGVQTMNPDQMPELTAAADADSGPFAVRTLNEDETIARLASGIKRFRLPGEFDYIAILRRLAQGDDSRGSEAARKLAVIFENRQQYTKALPFWQLVLERSLADAKEANEAINRITGKNGMLEGIPVVPAGTAAKIPFVYRNGESVRLTAYRLDLDAAVSAVRTAAKNNSREDGFFWSAESTPELAALSQKELSDIAAVSEKAAEWEVRLSPPDGHYSAREYIEVPFTGAGCYMVEAAVAGGNVSRAVIWVADLAVTRKNYADKHLIFVADAVTGEPVPGVNVSFFGYYAVNNARRIEYRTREFAEYTDGSGMIALDPVRLNPSGSRNTPIQWLIAARAEDGRMALLRPERFWQTGGQERLSGTRGFTVTDRPVYRPDQTVHFKIWIGNPRYGEDAAVPAGTALPVTIYNPRREEIFKETFITDAYGGVSGELTLDAEAMLGMYYISYPLEGGSGGAGFRVEEYRKPEYEVTVETPDKALPLGDTAQIKVKAAYYYGAPVTDASVHYKILRRPYRDSWTPAWEWDWLYGGGSWWRPYRYSWFSGWSDWASIFPPPDGWGHQPPEVDAEGEGTLDADGVFRIPLDTASAKELFGNSDHEYTITAEVTDKSRRTVAGTGRVVASRKPFSTAVWTDRGYYSAGQEITARVRTRLPAGGGLRTEGKAVLYRVRYTADGTPEESEISQWDAVTDAAGAAQLTLRADRPGQYRLAFRMQDADGSRDEGAVVITVHGPGGEGDFRFADLELMPDKTEYAPGDTLRLAVNSANKKAVVLVFVRPESGFAPPQVHRLENGSGIVSIPVTASDQPNFFCEALTIYDGSVYSVMREIFVPPADKTLQVNITSDKEAYLPGEKAVFTVTVTDRDGKPVTGQNAVSLYDRSVDYIAGEAGTDSIRDRFWKWKRHYGATVTSSLQRGGYRVRREEDTLWEPIGVFGRREIDWSDGYSDAEADEESIAVSFRRNAVVALGGQVNTRYFRGSNQLEALPAPAMVQMAKAADTDMLVSADAAPAGMALPAAPEAARQRAMEEPSVRSEFADTAFWTADLMTDETGKAVFETVMPENLTAWSARVWTMASGLRVGEAKGSVETRKNVIIRPQAPRFLTQKDQVILSASLHNYLSRAKDARAELVLEGGLLEPAEGTELTRTFRLAAGGEARADWLVTARRPGEARIVVKLLTDEESDAAEITVPVVVHGARRVENFGGVLRNEPEVSIRFTVPEERLPEQSKLELSFSPTIASAMLEALPYLIEYPYGCTEQTLNRFLPAAVTRNYLKKMGASLADAAKTAGLPADEASEAWKKRYGDPRVRRAARAVFDDKELTAMVKAGIERLGTMQNGDGGWGWFSGAGEQSWPHTTAVVVYGLLTARDSGIAVSPDVLDSGIAWLRACRDRETAELRKYTVTKDTKKPEGKSRASDLDAFVHMILARVGSFSPDMRDFLYRDRLSLSLSGLSMLGLALHDEKAGNFLETVLGNLDQYAEENAEIGTAWLRTPERGWWWWYNDRIEVQTWYLRLLSRTDPSGARASGVAKHLLRNRKNGSYWQSTRDTAYAIDALAEYAAASGETAPDMAVIVYLDGAKVMERKLTPENILGDSRFLLEGLAVEAGEHELKIVRTGSGNLYYSGALDVFSLEDPIPAAGLEMKVTRRFFRLIREDRQAQTASAAGRAAAVNIEHYRREPIPSPFDSGMERVDVRPGDLVEVELTVEAANDYEYIVIEDMKAAGLEAVDVQSGYSGNALGAYVEYRDQKIVLFVRSLRQGTHTVSYRLRAETPGWFSALPAFGGGMYAADLFTNSDEMKVKITEAGVFE